MVYHWIFLSPGPQSKQYSISGFISSLCWTESEVPHASGFSPSPPVLCPISPAQLETSINKSIQTNKTNPYMKEAFLGHDLNFLKQLLGPAINCFFETKLHLRIKCEKIVLSFPILRHRVYICIHQISLYISI